MYRSKLISPDRAACNWDGGNTFMKTTEIDFRGREIKVSGYIDWKSEQVGPFGSNAG